MSVAGRFTGAVRRTARLVVERPRSMLWSLLAATAALFALGVAGMVAENVDVWTRAPRGRASVVVYLGEGVDDAHGTAMTTELGKQSWVDHAEYVPPAESAKRLQAALGPVDATAVTTKQLMDGVDVASLPASIEITLAPGVRDVVAMSPAMTQLRKTPGVDDVVLEDGGEDRVAATLSAVRAVAWSGAALFAGLALLVVLASIRVRLDRSRREAAVAQLLGAGPGYFAIPSALAGMVQGALAAGVAAGALYAAATAYGESLTSTLSRALGSIELALPPAPEIAMFVAAGAALGLIGGSLAGVTRATR
jgi:cell division protein FtsX